MQQSNYHSHCTFCDGRSHPEDFVRFALSHGFRAYGFSSHSPLPFETNWNMSKDEMPAYLAEIQRLKEKYDGRIELYAGLEIDYLDTTYNASIPYFRELPLDYRIGSIHFLPISNILIEDNMVCIDGSFREYAHSVSRYFEGDIRKLVERYYRSSMEMIEAGGIDIVGHLDKIYMNGQRFATFSLDAPWYQELVQAYLERIAQLGLMVEINTKNWSQKQELYPHQQWLKRIAELHIPVMVNSDCHYPHLVNDGREETFELLKTCGFQTTRELVGGRWEDMGI